MILFKTHNPKPGFSFVELMIALFIIATTLSALFGLQNAIFNRLVQSYYRVSRIFPLKKMLVERMFDLAEEEKAEGKESIEDPRTTLTWKDTKVPAQGAFENVFHVERIHVQGRWKTMLGDRTEDMLGIRYVPPEESKESEEPEQKEETQKSPPAEKSERSKDSQKLSPGTASTPKITPRSRL